MQAPPQATWRSRWSPRITAFHLFSGYHLPLIGFLVATIGGFVDRVAGLHIEAGWVQFAGTAIIVVATYSALTTFRRDNDRRYPALGRCILATLASLPNLAFSPPQVAKVYIQDALLVIDGTIDDNTVRQAAIALANRGCKPLNPAGAPGCPEEALVTSPGGRITATTMLSALFRVANINRVVAHGHCLSACSSILLAQSPRRAATPGTVLGFHSSSPSTPVADSTGLPIFKSVSNAILMENLVKAGLTNECVGALLYSSKMALASPAELSATGMAIEPAPAPWPARHTTIQDTRPFPCDAQPPA